MLVAQKGQSTEWKIWVEDMTRVCVFTCHLRRLQRAFYADSVSFVLHDIYDFVVFGTTFPGQSWLELDCCSTMDIDLMKSGKVMRSRRRHVATDYIEKE